VESGFPHRSPPLRAPCKSAYKKPSADPGLPLPRRARLGAHGPCAFSFCVAPSNPSRSSRLGLAQAWRGGATACSGIAGARSVPSSRPPSARRGLGATAGRRRPGGPLTAGAGQSSPQQLPSVPTRVTTAVPGPQSPPLTLTDLPFIACLPACLAHSLLQGTPRAQASSPPRTAAVPVVSRWLSRSRPSQAHAARQQTGSPVGVVEWLNGSSGLLPWLLQALTSSSPCCRPGSSCPAPQDRAQCLPATGTVCASIIRVILASLLAAARDQVAAALLLLLLARSLP
jgi:hypothetical protein